MFDASRQTLCKVLYNAQSEPFLALDHQNLPATLEFIGCGFFTKLKENAMPKPNLYNLPAGENAPEIVNVVIEVPRGGSNKYEYDKDFGVMKLDRVLFASMSYPGDYGFIPSTLGGDGDPLDVVLLSTHPFHPGVLVEARVVGMLVMKDDKGEDEKILAVTHNDPRFTDTVELEDVAAHVLDEIEHFFSEYKTLEGKAVETKGWRNRVEAMEEILYCIERGKRVPIVG
jgi:inorganic pyrophosphatase